MKKITLIFFFLSTIFLCSCGNEEDSLPEFVLDQPDQLQSDEYEVYGKILEGFSQSQLIVRQQTSIYTPPKESFELFFNLENMSGMESTLYFNYVQENKAPYLLADKIEISSKGTKLLSNKEYSHYFDRDNGHKSWELFQNKYPDSGAWFFYVNKIGFNEDRTQALVGQESYWFMESSDGTTSNGGRLYYLEKINGEWVLIGSSFYQL
ncbi:hypothetical protein [Algoriphagus sp. Y33]|uniref:hypothetical protein n=1 Tax=Algoriphagus sp. Y33 TaxID=2772483 RepID=UPI00177FD6D7|nr:hypothetical protein [Algoriphagus sp. Y33]